MAQITYANKVALNENPEIAAINKVSDDDMNEIKQVVNDNYNNTIQITNTEPTDSDNKIWIDTGEIGSQASEITNEYSTSTRKGYSANYVNQKLDDINNLIPVIDTGTQGFQTTSDYVDENITFNKTFTEPPAVFLSLVSNTTNTNYEHMIYMVFNITATGFTLRVVSSFANLYPTIRWVAMGN